MDFSMNRNVHPPAGARTAPTPDNAPGGGIKKAPRGETGWRTSPGWLKVVWVALLFAVTILLASMTALLFLSNARNEASYIDKDKVQAVFLDNGQVYFGKIHTVNDRFMDLQGIYYLSVDQPVQPEQEGAQQGNITLEKLGCEMHGPVDQMIINRDHITFWENLRDDGQVSRAIAQWLEQHPDGRPCPDPAEQQQNNNAEAQTENAVEAENQESQQE